mmetsp:Transcript_8143/g.50420  ORF Transcript_8143/g.50420 Transcript_8143/m.50420 type:complete len:290 (+) Transcript_8143:1063-1932(+)
MNRFKQCPALWVLAPNSLRPCQISPMLLSTFSSQSLTFNKDEMLLHNFVSQKRGRQVQSGRVGTMLPPATGCSLASAKSCILRTLQFAKETLNKIEELILIGHFPWLGFWKWKALVNGIQQPEYASQTPRVSDSPVHDVPNCELRHLPLLVEAYAAGLRRCFKDFACGRTKGSILVMFNQWPGGKPHTIRFERIHAEVILPLRDGEAFSYLEATQGPNEFRFGQWPNHRSGKLEGRGKHITTAWDGESARQEIFGHDDELFGRLLESGIFDHGIHLIWFQEHPFGIRLG